MGSAYASVLPEPVGALMHRSCAALAPPAVCAQAAACTGNSSAMPPACTLLLFKHLYIYALTCTRHACCERQLAHCPAMPSSHPADCHPPASKWHALLPPAVCAQVAACTGNSSAMPPVLPTRMLSLLEQLFIHFDSTCHARREHRLAHLPALPGSHPADCCPPGKQMACNAASTAAGRTANPPSSARSGRRRLHRSSSG